MMNPNRLKTLLDAYGADPRRWPAAERAAAQALLVSSVDARAAVQDAQRLDALLDRVPVSADAVADPALLAAIIATTVPPAGRRPARPWTEAFAARFAFGWPNFAALAAAAVVGFLIGWTDLNQSAAASRDMVDMITPVTVEEPLW
ncbi:MAG TPA: hypothetical protein VGB82_09675 [Alphaproteobacteria bacterium]